MRPMRFMTLALSAVFAAVVFGCSDSGAASTATATLQATTSAPTASAQPLLFTIGMHIEPLGATAQQSAAKGGSNAQPGLDYNNQQAFDRAVADINTVATMVEAHGGHMTIQAQSPFTTSAITYNSSILSDLENRGHEIGLHFHESDHLGKDGNAKSVAEWCAVFQQEIGFIKQAGVETVNYWSGGNLYPGLLDAATCAGLSVNSDWKNPATQSTDPSLIGTAPWRPAGSTNGTDTSQFARHDPNGPVVFLPEGNFDKPNFASMRRSDEAGGDEAYFQYLAASLNASIASAEPGKVNVFHFTVHAGEFRGSPTDPFGVIERFLTDVVDPLVKQGKVQWATFSQMAQAFETWEKANPGVDARTGTPVAVETVPATPPAPSAATPANPGRPAAPPPSPAGNVERDVTYCTGAGEALKMDIYHPTTASGAAPAILYVHGGGWTSGDKSGGTGSEAIPELVKRGYVVAAVNYRVAPVSKFPAQIEDVKCAVRFLRANAAAYGIDPEHIGAMGGSAGGHLVSLLGVTDANSGLEGKGGYANQSSRVQAVVDMFGPADLTVDFNGANSSLLQSVFGATNRSDAVVKAASPATWVSKDDPPFLIVHGDKDTLVPLSQSQELYDRLAAVGVSAKLVVVKNAGHGFAPTGGQISPSRGEIIALIADFFDANLKAVRQ